MKDDFKAKAIAGTGASLIIASMGLGGWSIHQSHKIDDLKDELYLKQQNEQRASDHYESILNVKTIQSKFNTMQEYAVQKNNVISKQHTYYYTSDGRFGIKKEAKLVGRAQMRYDIVVNLRDAEVTPMNDGKTIKVKIDKPYIDESNIGMVNNSLIMDSVEYNFWAGKQDTAEAQKLFIESFEESGKKDILALYQTKEKHAYINKVAKSEIKALIQNLNLNGNVTVIVEIAD
jgi:hypothetical protein